MNLEELLGSEWYKLLAPLFETEWMTQLGKRITYDRDQLTPDPANIFNAYKYCQPSDLKVLLLGQDPYPGKGVAQGLSFSCRDQKPASLRIIFKELERSGFGVRTETDLTDWALQGVMLLNTLLTTTVGNTLAHADIGWERFTAYTLRLIDQLPQKIVVFAWGKPAQMQVKANMKSTTEHLILEACHPMAEQYSGGKIKFVGCDHFVKANAHLDSPIKWV